MFQLVSGWRQPRTYTHTHTHTNTNTHTHRGCTALFQVSMAAQMKTVKPFRFSSVWGFDFFRLQVYKVYPACVWMCVQSQFNGPKLFRRLCLTAICCCNHCCVATVQTHAGYVHMWWTSLMGKTHAGSKVCLREREAETEREGWKDSQHVLSVCPFSSPVGSRGGAAYYASCLILMWRPRLSLQSQEHGMKQIKRRRSGRRCYQSGAGVCDVNLITIERRLICIV